MYETLNEISQSSSTEKIISAQLQKTVVSALSKVLALQDILFTPEDTIPYECDGLTAYRQRPLCVAIPQSLEQVQQILKICHSLAACHCSWRWNWTLRRCDAQRQGGYIVIGEV